MQHLLFHLQTNFKNCYINSVAYLALMPGPTFVAAFWIVTNEGEGLE